MRKIVLQIKDMSVLYGHISAIRDISIDVEKGAIISVLGANGAGKSTLLKAISGIVKKEKGTIKFHDKAIDQLSVEEIVSLGISQVPEGRMIFPSLTVRENLLMGAFLIKNKGLIKSDMERVFSYFPKLFERLKQKAQTLSGGEQQMLAIGRALMGKPSLLLLDEPSLGIAPVLKEEIFKIILSLNKNENLTMLLVEQDADISLDVCNYVYVLETGKIVVSGPRDEIIKQKDLLLEAYLGM